MIQTIQSRIRESIETKEKLLVNNALIDQLECLAKDCLDALRSGGKIIFAGNGGSFADALHL